MFAITTCLRSLVASEVLNTFSYKSLSRAVVLVGDVSILHFLFFLQDYHEKSSALLLSSAGLFAFYFLILKPSHKSRPPPPTPAVMRVVTQQA